MHRDTGLKSVISPINFNGRTARQLRHSSSGSLVSLAMRSTNAISSTFNTVQVAF